ncbi:hypothetical protein GMDG_00660 [Pseudogymnoascus destructans 20631-21]|uniref:A-factor receptor n=1 Tax=Pseudogymnoascus destructans (strain ATCC MYA-4855 / 20631-21) TaxID=658429 RepID=L8G9Z9_PSED2|nr:hypothetical protein GMDG_00660 [Pseudogymnoascus destructans 20631-21]
MVFINVLIWPDNNFATWWDGKVLCDIEVKILWPITVGVAASTMTITRSLAKVLDVENMELNPSRAQRRRKVWVDLAICFAVPLLIVGLHHVVHNRRYLIVAIGGCTDSYSGSWPTIVIIFIWPLIFTLLNVFYAAVVITRLHRHRSNITTILTSHSLNSSRFLRLFLLSLLLLFIYLPLNIYWFYTNLTQLPFEPYSWSAIHDPTRWESIPYVPAMGVFTFDRYVPAAMALFVFAFFGVGTEARRIYAAMAMGLGLGKCFPRLLQERRPSVDGGNGGGWDKLSLVAFGKRYVAKFSSSSSRGGTQAATEMVSTTTRTSSRKPSAVALEDISAPSFTFKTTSHSHSHTSSPRASISPSTHASPFPPHTASLLTRLHTFLHLSPTTNTTTTTTSRTNGGGVSATSTRRGDMEMDIGTDTETHDLVQRQGSRTHVWSPRSLGPQVEGGGGNRAGGSKGWGV